jgi:hypothetical protein
LPSVFGTNSFTVKLPVPCRAGHGDLDDLARDAGKSVDATWKVGAVGSGRLWP